MKIPIVPIHLMTSRTLRDKMQAARDEGVTEGKAFSKTQIEMLLNRRAIKPIRPIANKKQRTQK